MMTHDPNLVVILHVGAALFLIVLSAQVCGRFARAIGQPAVVGEMVSGVLLGPTLLGAFAPEVTGYIFDEHSKPVLYTMAMIGLSLYMFLVGLSHSHPTGTTREKTIPVVLALSGLIGPLALGSAAGALLVADMKPDGISTGVFALFVGGALAVTAFPMLARIMQERNMIGTAFGRVATSAAAIDDALAWCVLAVVGALATAGTLLGSLWTIIPAIVLAGASFWLLPRFFRRPLERSVKQGHLGDGLVAVLVALVLGVGWVCDYIGIYSVFGGFVAGAALPKVRGFAPMVDKSMSSIVRCFFLPIFFAYSGMNTDLLAVFHIEYLAPLVGILIVAVAGKSITAYAVLRLSGWARGESAAMGALMNARGLMILIFINVGLSLNIISRPLFSILVAVAVITTALATPVYRRAMPPEAERAARSNDTHHDRVESELAVR
ncbi:cation:proton antiporter [Actinomycetes bacterium M1A6_2h]